MRYTDEASIRETLGRNPNRQLNMLLDGGNVEWSARDEQDRPLPIFSARGGKEYLLAGREGARYELVYINRGKRHYEIIATVDGLDVLTGLPGSLDNTGYLLSPGKTVRIEGFRKSQREVATFRFSAKNSAYANNTSAGDARNVGVIGSALFEVRVNEPDTTTRTPPEQTGEPNPFPGDPVRPYAPPPQYRQ
jgi:hypothetical protein